MYGFRPSEDECLACLGSPWRAKSFKIARRPLVDRRVQPPRDHVAGPAAPAAPNGNTVRAFPAGPERR